MTAQTNTQYGTYQTTTGDNNPQRFYNYDEAIAYCVRNSTGSWTVTDICNGYKWRSGSTLAHFEQRGWLTMADGNGNLRTLYGWFMITGDNNIAKRKIGGRNWTYYGETRSIVAFVADKKGK